MRSCIQKAWACLLLAGLFAASASGQSLNLREGAFTAAQAQLGSTLYATHCAQCHGAALEPSDPAFPGLIGSAFRWAWNKRTLFERFNRVRSAMPPGAAGSLSDEQYVAILAFVLHANGFPAGTHPLPTDSDVLESIRVVLPD